MLLHSYWNYFTTNAKSQTVRQLIVVAPVLAALFSGGGEWCRNPLTHANVNSDEEDTTEEAAETAWVSFDYIKVKFCTYQKC